VVVTRQEFEHTIRQRWWPIVEANLREQGATDREIAAEYAAAVASDPSEWRLYGRSIEVRP
jgi:hypothetical protein